MYRDGAGAAWKWTFGPLGIFVLVVALALLFTGRYPRGLYDLLVGIARWTLRVIAFVALLTGEYPPFRLDQGGDDPDDDPDPEVVTGRAHVEEPAVTTQAQ
jgi:hypothetical protein